MWRISSTSRTSSSSGAIAALDLRPVRSNLAFLRVSNIFFPKLIVCQLPKYSPNRYKKAKKIHLQWFPIVTPKNDSLLLLPKMRSYGPSRLILWETFMAGSHGWRTGVFYKSDYRWFRAQEGMKFGGNERGRWGGFVLILTCAGDTPQRSESVLSKPSSCIKKKATTAKR